MNGRFPFAKTVSLRFIIENTNLRGKVGQIFALLSIAIFNSASESDGLKTLL